MGRGRVELKRIENKISRQVTFSKRRSGLWKKANEISVLCDSELALIVFSTNGKLFHYSSTHSSMERVLARYEQHIFSHKKAGTSDDQPKDNLLLDHPKLVARLELLQKHTRNYAGEDLDPLSLRELQSLEQQLDNSLKRIRTKRNQLMHESLSKLQKKERSLQDQNSSLKKQLKEKEKKRQELEGLANALTLPHTTLTIGEGAGSQHGSRDESESAFAQNDGTGDEDESNQSRSSGPNTLIPPWLLSHVKSPVTFRPH